MVRNSSFFASLIWGNRNIIMERATGPLKVGKRLCNGQNATTGTTSTEWGCICMISVVFGRHELMEDLSEMVREDHELVLDGRFFSNIVVVDNTSTLTSIMIKGQHRQKINNTFQPIVVGIVLCYNSCI